MPKFIIKPSNTHPYWDVDFVLVEYDPEDLETFNDWRTRVAGVLKQLGPDLRAVSVKTFNERVHLTTWEVCSDQMPKDLISAYEIADEQDMVAVPDDFDPEALGFDGIRTDCHTLTIWHDGTFYFKLCNKYGDGMLEVEFPTSLLAPQPEVVHA